ncbi:MAG: L-seryl-tRNA(Sec) kinase [Candidatus Methanofastidiosum methylothiophilum]|uniref:L-seryl-tRNA(Sec) kinase n=1 Tax=Candidatus Methanofastidiosum methylothiophilum TaxID=1705564 RepID=A0A150IWP6_9EURY|nr:MAG: L-seryl-tRNA(Sec) kinase [Candidatus Methanofastidiosum methylthiophilus]KYC47788.1 MAG: L-seryl-tRNA(Sec) kinase [Candidatus Methanofastidiosum methylthiophilus]KYC49416.1 MAG: L-seryl-tRNA(Sec) kinase [Candidatus Methanofastidiosum methylthiophilus]
MLVVITGLPGTGKTTIAEALARDLDAIVFSTDKIRKMIFEKPVYNEEDKKIVYNELFSQTSKYLNSDKNVILDGTFYSRDLRQRAKEVGKSLSEKVIFVYCETPEELLKKRITSRKDKYSDADYGVYLKMKEIFEEFEEDVVRINTANPVSDNIEIIKKRIYSI